MRDDKFGKLRQPLKINTGNQYLNFVRDDKFGKLRQPWLPDFYNHGKNISDDFK